MLHIEKENLIANTVKDVAALRDMEFRFYVSLAGIKTALPCSSHGSF
jgi:hypothetical protein